MAKTKKPKGLSIARSGFKFTCTWKIADSDYGGGQEFEYRTKGATGWRKWKSVSCGKTTTSKAVKDLKAADFYPTVGDKLLAFQFRVRGNRKSYKKDGKTVNPGWSDWEDKTYECSKLPKPTLSEELTSGYTNKTTFSWAMPSLGDKQMFTDIQWQTILVVDCDYTDGSKPPYGALTTVGSSGSTEITEDSSQLSSGHSYTRWFRAKARGPFGDSDWAYTKHVYGLANKPTNTTVRTTSVTGGIEVVVNWNSSSTTARPIDGIVIQKVATTPAAGLTCPSGASWTDVATVSPKDGSDGYRWIESSSLSDDTCLFVRVNTVHDGQSTPGAAMLACAGGISPPENIGLSFNPSNFKAWVAVDNNCDIPDSNTAVVFHGSSITPYIAGIVVHGEESDPIVIQLPDVSQEDEWAFEAYAFVGSYSKQTRSDGIDCYTITAYSGKPLLKSSSISTQGTVPKAPTNLTLSETDIAGTIRATWDWSWTEADGTELSWADHSDAWESTSEPSTYEINSLHAGAWNISGLETGKRWYVRTRFWKGTGDDRTYGPYSDIADIDLAEAPMVPVLQFSSPVISASGETTAYWGYVSGDGTPQAYAEICTATISSGVITRGNVIAHTEAAYSITLKPSELGWTSGNTYNLCVRVYSASGKQTEWSAPVPITIAPQVTCALSSTSLETVTVPDDEDDETTRQVLSLTEMPLSVTVSGGGNDKTTIIVVERAADYHVERPDDEDFDGYEGETIALITLPTGASSVDIENSDLYGKFDDGAQYRLIATVIDSYGQRASASTEFEVHWDHQAIIPEAEVQTFQDERVVVITPIAPTGAANTDRCDIYRLSADKPILIYEDAEFGTPYVDPFPALGDVGGHRVVLKTADGDYITAANQFAWIDLGVDDGDCVDDDSVIIDFGNDRAILKQNIDVSSSWAKDFVETHYLGGAIQGDWNPGVSRTSSVNAVVLVNDNMDAILAMRRLAVYTGICNVRTPDGSSFTADVQVSEDRSYNTAGKIATFKMSITRADPEKLEGVKYGAWILDAVGLLDENGNKIVDENGVWIFGVI